MKRLFVLALLSTPALAQESMMTRACRAVENAYLPVGKIARQQKDDLRSMGIRVQSPLPDNVEAADYDRWISDLKCSETSIEFTRQTRITVRDKATGAVFTWKEGAFRHVITLSASGLVQFVQAVGTDEAGKATPIFLVNGDQGFEYDTNAVRPDAEISAQEQIERLCARAGLTACRLESDWATFAKDTQGRPMNMGVITISGRNKEGFVEKFTHRNVEFFRIIP